LVSKPCVSRNATCTALYDAAASSPAPRSSQPGYALFKGTKHTTATGSVRFTRGAVADPDVAAVASDVRAYADLTVGIPKESFKGGGAGGGGGGRCDEERGGQEGRRAVYYRACIPTALSPRTKH
jgi:hypothetical protein